MLRYLVLVSALALLLTSLTYTVSVLSGIEIRLASLYLGYPGSPIILYEEESNTVYAIDIAGGIPLGRQLPAASGPVLDIAIDQAEDLIKAGGGCTVYLLKVRDLDSLAKEVADLIVSPYYAANTIVSITGSLGSTGPSIVAINWPVGFAAGENATRLLQSLASRSIASLDCRHATRATIPAALTGGVAVVVAIAVPAELRVNASLTVVEVDDTKQYKLQHSSKLVSLGSLVEEIVEASSAGAEIAVPPRELWESIEVAVAGTTRGLRGPMLHVSYRVHPTPEQAMRVAAASIASAVLLYIDYQRRPDAYRAPLKKLLTRLRRLAQRG